MLDAEEEEEEDDDEDDCEEDQRPEEYTPFVNTIRGQLQSMDPIALSLCAREVKKFTKNMECGGFPAYDPDNEEAFAEPVKKDEVEEEKGEEMNI